jgi:hypothetical protein
MKDEAAGKGGSEIQAATKQLDESILTPAADWRQNAAAVLEVLANTGHPFTADTVTQLAGYPPNRHQLGSVLAAAKRQRIAEPVGAAVGEGNRLVRVWVRCPR